MKPVAVAFATCLACFAGTAFADRLVLKDGQVLEGAVSEDGNTINIKLDYGTVGFHRDEVKSIEKTSSPIAELEKRKAAVSRTDAAALRELAAWAEKQGLETQARAIYRQVLELAPDDAAAHEKLGHQKVDGKWLAEDEVMIARGFVRYNGTWKTPDEVRVLEDEERARRERTKARDEETRRWSEARRRSAAAGDVASGGDAFAMDGVFRTPVRPRSNFPAYESYDDATAPLYVTPGMNAAIFFPGGYPSFKLPRGTSKQSPPASAPPNTVSPAPSQPKSPVSRIK